MNQYHIWPMKQFMKLVNTQYITGAKPQIQCFNKHHTSNSTAAHTEKQTHTAVIDSCMREGQKSAVRPTVMSVHKSVCAHGSG